MFLGKGVYLRDLSIHGGECGFFCPLLVQFHCVPDGYPYCTELTIHVFVLAHTYMGRLSLYAKPFKLFNQYQG